MIRTASKAFPGERAFSESDTFVKVEDSGRVQTYELKGMTTDLGIDLGRFHAIQHDRRSVCPRDGSLQRQRGARPHLGVSCNSDSAHWTARRVRSPEASSNFLTGRAQIAT